MAKSKKFNYFEAYISLTNKAIEEADLLIEVIKNYKREDQQYIQDCMQKAHDIEHAADGINHQIYKNIAVEFITPIDREDLIELAQSLDNIIDQIEEVIQRFYTFDVHNVREGALDFAKILKKACVALNKCTVVLPNFKKNVKELRELIVDVNDAEEEADMLYLDIIRQLYTQYRDNPTKLIVWSSIFELLEECCDACEHASDVMRSVIFNNS